MCKWLKALQWADIFWLEFSLETSPIGDHVIYHHSITGKFKFVSFCAKK